MSLMEQYNLIAGWIGILLGFMAGAVLGLFFYKDDWLGGYSSWPRRMARLGHISFFGIALINLSFAFTIRFFDLQNVSIWSSRLFIVGAVAMPLICFLSAYQKNFRHLFPIPVLSLLIGVILFFIKGLFT